MAVNAEGGQALLVVGGEHGGEIDRAGPFGAVVTPDSLRDQRVHVHRFAAITPARGDSERNADVLAREFFGARRRLGHTADAGVGDDALDGLAVRVAQIGGKEFRGGLRHAHDLAFQGLADALAATVNGRANADFWK